MSNQDNHDISNIQVPDSFIQEILNETQPLKEGREEVHPAQETAQTVSEDGKIVKLLSLLFEEFDKLNSRLDKLQEGLTETSVGGLGVGPGAIKRPKPKRKPKNESTSALAQLLARRTGK